MSNLNLSELKRADDADENLLSRIQENSSKLNNDILPKNNAITFSEAIAQTKFGTFNYLVIFVSGMVLAHVLLETSAIGFILPIAQCDLNLSTQDKGVLSAIGFAGIILSSHLWGFLADTKGRRAVMRPTLIAGFVVTLLSSFSNNFWVMVLLRFINGFFVSGGSAVIFAYLGEFHTDKSSSRAIMGSSVIFAVGAMTLPVMAFVVINQDWILPLPFLGMDYKPWRLFLVVCGIPGFLCGLSLYVLPESPKFLFSLGREAETVQVLKQMLRWNGGKETLQISHILPELDPTDAADQLQGNFNGNSNFVVTFLKTMWNQTVPLFRKEYLRTTLIVCTLQFWLYMPTYGMYMWFPHIMNFMVEFMKEHPGEHKQICQIVYEKQAALIKTDGSIECITKLEESTYFYSLILEILFAASFAFLGVVINKVGSITILFISMILFASCGFAAVFITDPAVAAYLYVLLFLVGVAIHVLGAATVELYPTHLRAMAICISLMIGRLGSLAGASLVGALLDNYCELTFYIACTALIVCAFLALLIPRKRVEQPITRGIEE